MSSMSQGIPLYQLMEMHRHVRVLKEAWPSFDFQTTRVAGSHSPIELRKKFTQLDDATMLIIARAVAGLIDCDRIIGMVELNIARSIEDGS